MQFSSKSALALTTLAALGLAVARPAQAAPNLVQDGDFESAPNSTAGYTTASPFDTHWVIGGSVGINTDNKFVYDGHNSLFLNNGVGTDSITQNLSTVANQTYTLSFVADAGGIPTPPELDVTFGGTTLAPIFVPVNGFAGPPPGNNSRFTSYSFTVTATGPFTGLSFTAPNTLNNTPGLELDDIVVAPVPEASTTVSFGLLLALGLGGMMVAARRKKAARS